MDLAELNFKVNTKELLDAVQTIDKVADAIKNLNTANSSSSNNSSSNSPVAQIVTQAPKAVASTDRVNRALEKQAEKMKILRNETITVADGIVQLGDGFTNSQAGMLANLKLMNATESQMKALAASFMEYNKITGVNTFDKSAAGLEKLQKQLSEIQNVNKLSAEGFNLTREQLILLNRDIERVTQAFTSSNNEVMVNGKTYRTLDEALKNLKQDFIGLASSVNIFEKEAKDAELAAKKLAAEESQAQLAGMRMNDDAVKLFIKNEEAKQRKIQQTIKVQEESAAKQRLMDEGYKPSEASRIVSLTGRGVSETDAKNEIAVARQIAEANKIAAESKKEVARVEKERLAALKFITDAEQHLNAQIAEGNKLTADSTDKLTNYKNALRTVGVGAAEAAAKTQLFQANLTKLDFKQKEREIQNLGRAMSTQMGDVAISLASGMNPLLVAIQQGDQIRYAINQSTLAGEEMSKAMRAGAAQIASSFILTAKVIGDFFVGSIISAGKATTQLIASFFGVKKYIDEISEANTKLGNSTSITSYAIKGLSAAFSGFFSVLALGIPTAIIAAIVGFVQLIKEQDKLVTSLAMTSGSLGLTFDSAINYANSMDAAGVSTNKAIQIISEMGKTGVLTSKEIDMVATAAYNLEKYGGQSIEETVKKFAELKKDPVDALIKVAKETGMVTAASIELVHQLEEQGKGSEAAAEAMKIYANVTATQLSRMKEEYSAFGLWIKEILAGGAQAWDDLKRAMLQATPKRQKLITEAADFNMKSMEPGISEDERIRLETRRDYALGQVKLIDEQTSALERQTQVEQQKIKLQEKAWKLDDKNKTSLENYHQRVVALKEDIKRATEYWGEGSDQVKSFMNDLRVISEKEAKILAAEMRPKQRQETKTTKENAKLLEIYNDILGKAAGYTKEYNNQVEALNEAEKRELITQDQRMEAFDALVRQQPFAIKLQKDLTKETKDYTDALELLDRIQGKDAGFNKDYVETVHKLVDAFKRGFFGDTGEKGLSVLQEAVTLLTKQQPLYENKRKALEDIEKMLLEGNKHIQDEQGSLQESLDKYRQIAIVQFDINTEAEKAKKIREIVLDTEKKILEVRSKKGLSEDDKTVSINEINEQAAKRIEIANRKAAQAYKEEFDKLLQPLQEGITDSIVTALFEGGKEGRKKLRDLIVNEIKKPITMVLNIFVQDILTDLIRQVTNSDSSSGGITNSSGSSGGIGGTISTIDSVFKLVSGKYEAAIGKAYSTFATSSYGQQLGLSVADTGGVTLTGAGELGASVASTAGYGIAGYGLYKGISGGYETNKLVDVVGKFAGLFGPYGVVVAAIAGAINRAFGSKLKDFGVQGTFGGESGFQGQTYKDFKGGWFKSDSTETGALDKEIQQMIGNQFKEVRTSIVGFATQLGVDASKIVGYTKDIKFSTKDLDSDPAKAAQQIQDQLQKEFEASAEEMAKLVLEGTNLRKGQETYLETLKRVSDTVKAVNESLDALGLKMFDVSLAGTEAAVNFADLFGGLSEAQTALQGYYTNFYSAEEKTKNAIAALTDEFKLLGIDVAPKTKDAFRDLVKEADAAGNTELVATLIKMSGAFAQLMTELEPSQSVDYFIDKLQDQKRSNEEIAQSIIGMQKETSQLQIDLLRATGQIDAANEAARQLATEGMTDAEKAIYNLNESLRKQIDIANERNNLENDLLRATNNTVELRKRELAAIDPANRALKELINTIEDAQKLNDAIDQQLPKFLPKQEYRDLKYHQFGQKLLDAGILAGVAIDDLAERLSTMSRDEIYNTVVEVMNMSHMTDEMRLTLVETAGAIADFNDEIADFEKNLRMNNIQASLDVINKEIGDFAVLHEPQVSISEQYVKNKELLGNILDFFGQKGKDTVESIVGKLLEQAEGLKNFRIGLKDQIEDARVKSMTRPDRVSYLKKREQSLYAELQTTNDPVRVAQKIQDTILERLQEEADIRSELADKEKEANDNRKKAIEDQISSLEKIKNLANEIHQFTSSLRFSDISPLNYQDQLGQAKTLFEETLAKAKTGDEDAISNLIENARAYIEEARSYFASGTEYAAIFNDVTGQLDALGVSSVDPQLDTLYKQLDALEAISKTQFDTEASVRQMNGDIVTQLGVLDEAVAAREEKTRDLLIEQKEILEKQVTNQEAQLKQWEAIAKALIEELTTLNGTTTKTLEQVMLENAAPVYDSEGRRL